MTSQPLRIGIVAGEPSGDVLAGGMIRELKRLHPEAIIEGIGGEHMQAAGCQSLFDIEELSVMGLVEVLSHLPAILRIKKQLLRHFEQNPPDIFVGVDAPDFNLRIERTLKARGIKTVHYVSPTVWAWRESRIHKIAKATNRVLGLFPFEQQVYDKYCVPYTFVGHTMADAIPLEPDQLAARASLGLNNEAPILAVLPGSRRGELQSLLAVFVAAMMKLKAQLPSCQFVIPAANQHRYETIMEYLLQHCAEDFRAGSIVLIRGNSREAMIASNAILLASGTATLEAMLCKRPMVAAYKLSKVTYKIMQKIYKAPFFSLPNLLAEERIVPELLQDEVNPDNLVAHLLPFFTSDNSKLIERFAAIHATLKQNADKKAAQAVLEVMHENV